MQGRFPRREGDEVRVAEVERDFEGEGKCAVRVLGGDGGVCREEFGGYCAVEAEEGWFCKRERWVGFWARKVG